MDYLRSNLFQASNYDSVTASKPDQKVKKGSLGLSTDSPSEKKVKTFIKEDSFLTDRSQDGKPKEITFTAKELNIKENKHNSSLKSFFPEKNSSKNNLQNGNFLESRDAIGVKRQVSDHVEKAESINWTDFENEFLNSEVTYIRFDQKNEKIELLEGNKNVNLSKGDIGVRLSSGKILIPEKFKDIDDFSKFKFSSDNNDDELVNDLKSNLQNGNFLVGTKKDFNRLNIINQKRLANIQQKNNEDKKNTSSSVSDSSKIKDVNENRTIKKETADKKEQNQVKKDPFAETAFSINQQKNENARNNERAEERELKKAEEIKKADKLNMGKIDEQIERRLKNN